MTMKWITDTIAKSPQFQAGESLLEEFVKGVDFALENGLRVDGVKLARACLNKNNLSLMQSLLFNEEAIDTIKNKIGITRIEFIVEGALPPSLLEESPVKSVPIYRQSIGYELCKSCRLCIEVCPKNVYRDDGSGRPDRELRRSEECTGPVQCGKCLDICPEKTISVFVAEPSFNASLYALLDNPFSEPAANENDVFHLYVANPLEVGNPLFISGSLKSGDLPYTLKILGDSHFYPVIELDGTQQHLVDSEAPGSDIERWCGENYLDPEITLQAVRLLVEYLPSLTGLKEGKYDFKQMIEGITDEIIYKNGTMTSGKHIGTLESVLRDAFINEPFFGAKRRPVGGLLPLGTSVAWQTPYGDEIPYYSRAEKCLGPECALCFTNCPEGGGGENSAIRMVPLVPAGAIPSLVRGFSTHLLRLDGSHKKPQDAEALNGKKPFEFEVRAEYCKACGVCIAYCPHDVIESTPRILNLRAEKTK